MDTSGLRDSNGQDSTSFCDDCLGLHEVLMKSSVLI